jgi:hypothetical protein
LTFDTAVNQNFNQGDGRADSIFVDDKKLSEPAMSEDLMSWGFKKLALDEKSGA